MKSQNRSNRNRRPIIFKLIVLAIFVSTILYKPFDIVYSAGFSDDFNDGMQGTVWKLGVLRRSASEFDSAVKVIEQNGRLEISPLPALAGDHYNGYVSLATWDMTGGRATVEVIQVASGKAATIFSVGINNYDCYSFRAKGTMLHFEKKVGATLSTVSIPFSATNHRFWRFRHELVADSMVFETSADGTAWTVRRTVPREFSIAAMRAELNAGTSEIVSLPGTAVFDNFLMETTLTPGPSPTPTPESTPTATPTPTPTPTPNPTPAGTPTPTPNPTPSPGSCLDRSGPLITLSGDFTSLYRNTGLAANTRIDARFARWIHAGVVPFRIGGGANVCVEGGEIIGNYALSTTWDVMHATYAVMIRGGLNYLLSEIRIHNYGDGVYIGSENNDGFFVRGAYLSQIRDDAFQNDNGKPGVVEDCLVDGAYVGFSDQKYGIASADSVWEIRDTLVRLQVYEQTYVIGTSGHGWFWKWDADGIKLSLHGNIFYAEAPSIHGSHKLWPEKVVSCKKPDGSPDNIIVWGGTGPYPRPEELLTGCFTLTTDRRVWDDAVASWKFRHNR